MIHALIFPKTNKDFFSSLPLRANLGNCFNPGTALGNLGIKPQVPIPRWAPVTGIQLGKFQSIRSLIKSFPGENDFLGTSEIPAWNNWAKTLEFWDSLELFALDLKKKTGKIQNMHREEKLSRDVGLGRAFWRKNWEFLRMLLGVVPEFHKDFFSPSRGCSVLPLNPKIPAPREGREDPAFFPYFFILKSQHFPGKLQLFNI